MLEGYYHFNIGLLIGNLELHHPKIDNSQHKITPDLLVFKDKTITPLERRQLTSWNVVQRGAPDVVFEISSRSTWPGDIKGDVHSKAAIYGRIGVKEYWAYDGNDPMVWKNTQGRRLLGWRYDEVGQPHQIEPDERGWHWSIELESWLAADEDHLRIYDANGQLRLQASEVAALEAQVAQQAEDARQAAQQAVEVERKLARQAEAARLVEQQARQQAETAQQAAEAQRQAYEQRVAELERELRRAKGEE